jgi:predicted extracellular nuclease
LFVNHLKSMLDMFDPCNGRANTGERRAEQADAVVKIIEERFGASPGDQKFVVLGDLNDYMATDAQGDPAIASLVKWDQVENVVDRLTEAERWTHFFSGNTTCGIPSGYHQLDYLLLSRALADQVDTPPEIVRKGQPLRADRYTGERFEGSGSASGNATQVVGQVSPPTSASGSPTWNGRTRS